MNAAELSRRLRYGSRARFVGDMDPFGSEASFQPPIGDRFTADAELGGYYIDFTLKTDAPSWPPSWLAPRERQLHVATAQWGLGALERHLRGEDEAWLAAAMDAGEHLISVQQRGGPQDGGFQQLTGMPHTYRIDPPWLSAIAQGEAASLLARLHLLSGDERFAEAALAALLPLEVPVAQGGVLGSIEGGPFVEEYPTQPGSFVLNGALFALWGYHDVGLGLQRPEATARFAELCDVLEGVLPRYDTGYWSRYDLYPHALPNVATPAYHLLHIRQLTVMETLTGRGSFGTMARRFESYRATPANRRRAIAQKVAFRLVIPRNKKLAHRLPWAAHSAAERRVRRRAGRGSRRAIVLCYHAVSPDWEAPLSVTPAALEEQLGHLVRHGYRGVRFSDIALGRCNGKVFAVTFDDAYLSVLQRARPILDSFGLPGTLFVPTSYMGSGEPMVWPGIDEWMGGPHEAELIPMSWEEARTLLESGWEIGSHTVTHPKLTTLSDDDLANELNASREECERRLDHPCTSIAFPYGDHDDRVVAATERAGYETAATLPSRMGGEQALRWPRVGVYHADGMRSFRLKVSPTVQRVRSTGVWEPLLGLVRGRRPS